MVVRKICSKFGIQCQNNRSVNKDFLKIFMNNGKLKLMKEKNVEKYTKL